MKACRKRIGNDDPTSHRCRPLNEGSYTCYAPPGMFMSSKGTIPAGLKEVPDSKCSSHPAVHVAYQLLIQ